MTTSSRSCAINGRHVSNHYLRWNRQVSFWVPTHLALMLFLTPASAHAQDSANCQPFVFNGPVSECTASGSALEQLRTATFIAGSEAVGETLARTVALEVATAPAGSSSGGFTYQFNPITRIKSRRSGTFGPAFSERALTIGKGELSAGFNYLHRSYSELDGLSLDGFDVMKFHGGTLPITSSRVDLEITSDTLAAFASYGILDNLDVGVLIPYVHLSIAGTSSIYGVANDELQRVALDASAGGFGDITVSGKYRFWTLRPDVAGSERIRGGLAGAIAVRFPTGSEDDLLGLGVTRTALALVGSTTLGRWSPHVNLGYEFWSDGFPIPVDFQVDTRTISAKDQWQYSAGVEYEANPRLSLVVDVLGRYLRGAGGVGYQPFTFPPNFAGVSGTDAIVAVPTGVNKVLIAPGAKWNVLPNLLLTVNALIAPTDNGLRAPVTPVIGLDWNPN
jgi:hypothetical protein